MLSPELEIAPNEPLAPKKTSKSRIGILRYDLARGLLLTIVAGKCGSKMKVVKC